MDIVALDDHVAEIDANAEIHPAIRRHNGRAFGLDALDLHRAVQRLDHARELDQQPVAHGLDQSAAMLGNLWFENLAQIGPEIGTRSHLVGLAESAVADDVGDQDGGEPALHVSGRKSCSIFQSI